MLLLIAACHHDPTKPDDSGTPLTTPVPDTSSPTAPSCSLVGEYSVGRPTCDDAPMEIFILGTGTATIEWSLPQCVMALDLVRLDEAGGSYSPYPVPCHAHETLGLIEADGGLWTGTSSGSYADPDGCVEDAVVDTFALGSVATVVGSTLRLNFTGQKPWTLGECAGVASIELTAAR